MVAAPNRARAAAEEKPVRERRQVWVVRRQLARAWLLHAYLGHAGLLAASRQRGHAVGADLVAAFRAEQRPLASVRHGRSSGNAGVSREDPRRPLSASRLQTRQPVAIGPLASAGDKQGALGASGSALLIADSRARGAPWRIPSAAYAKSVRPLRHSSIAQFGSFVVLRAQPGGGGQSQQSA
jgi:hypothetical protein